ncbi:DUF1405 domain-containing protein [Staphylococcus massiliensis]|uniref:Membrane protein n=1 Tax=Staphylococcus massiliensis S46 TaxID=1229783 RepID=K9AY34_9STAP|nr:DUF1405 domain-containing protein [Staphylococcus massiliensis]EKU47462.1 membrane protein [Staphylococcus massiliensis S46]MCG3398895.1 DUF1405 domain-containing protein [Staphylococcus massiliensis]MCG3401102.1 DUF1405 domain-containing protein [Staphylococcus massiliensis]MCG3412238.1 DUF1405 domain-containing protein [Staphylococcus massiliensis]POA01123.1 DUF1405 domain-containing protein [Staphylococcus massiliensis CCUG 55927]
MNLMQNWRMLITNKFFLYFIILCNLLGTIYGYIWYGSQLAETPWYFYIFVPDSPTATLFLTISLILLLFNRKSTIIDTLAFVTLIKYGVWAVFMNIFMFYVDQTIYPMGVMLIMSHGIMAIQAFLFMPLFKFDIKSIIIALIWVFHNDVIDYVFHQYPKYGSLDPFEPIIAYVAFWLTVISFLCISLKKPLTENKMFDQS